MQVKNLQRYFFHAVKPYNKNDGSTSHMDESYIILDKILASRYLMTRNSLKGSLTSGDYEILATERRNHWQGDDAVCISAHPDNIEEVEDLYFERNEGNGISAWEAYITRGYPTIILDPLVVVYHPLNYPEDRMPDEIQVKGDVSLELMRSIGLYLPMLVSEEVLKRVSPKAKRQLLDCIENAYQRINLIRELLKLYDYDVPIINIANGKILLDDDKKYVKTLVLK